MNSPSKRAREIFEEALEIPSGAALMQYLDAACGCDTDLRERIDALLRAHEAARWFLPDAPLEAVEEALRSEKPGDVIGRYKLLEKIGEGGCGVVYLAEQQEPVRRQVAFKLIKLGMDTKAVVARFQAERQTLALMDHPNIARVFDAGATENGRPFFVMQWVNGLRLTDHCDKHRLSIPERLRLFLLVCEAIEHAHQKGVIHRDIKPSNILVTLHASVAVPKVIDFGIAKAIQAPLTEQALSTQAHELIGTPAYMSPEQAEMSALDVDTRTDIYSLGVLLYELLTGQTPFDARALLQSGLDELRKTIREVEPVRPSTCLKRQKSTKGPSGTQPSNGQSLISADLDWIVMKCLEKDRARRYDTASCLAQDIRNYLVDQPIGARPPSRLYVLGKMVRRNRGSFAALAAILFLLIAGVVASSLEALRAGRAERVERQLRQRAQLSERRAQQASDQARLQAYTSDMRAVASALSVNNFGEAVDLLRRYIPQAGEKDLRGIEWRYAWQAARGDEFRSFPQSSFVNCVRISPNDRVLAISTLAGEGRLMEIGSGQTLATFSVPRGKEMMELLAFSSDGKFFAACTPQGVELRQTTNWDVIQEIAGGCDALAFSPDSKTLAVMDDAGVRLYNGPGWEKRGTITVEGSGVGYLAFALEGRHLALLRLPGASVELWDLATQKKTAEFREIGAARVMIVSPNGRWLAVGNEEGELLLWDLPSQSLVLKQKLHKRWLFAMSFSPDGQSLATGGGDQVIHLWDTSSLPQAELARRATLRGHRSEVWSLAFSSDGGILASGSKDDTVKLWHARSPSQPFTRLPKMPGGTLLLGFVPQTKQVLVLPPEQNELQLWDALASKLVRRVSICPSGAVIYNAPCVFFGTTNGTAEIWTLPAGQRLREIQLNEGPLTALAGSADQKFLLGWDKTREVAVLWDLETGHRLAAFPDFASELPVGSWRKSQWAAFSPDNRWLAYASTNYAIKIRDLQQGTEAFTLRGHTWHVDCLRFSADSSRLASGSWDAEARVWDVATGRETVPPLKGQLSGIGTVSFSADGRTLAVWSGEDLHFWSLENGAQMLTIPKVAAWFFNIIAPDGNAMMWEEGALTGHFRVHWLPTLAEIDRLEHDR